MTTTATTPSDELRLALADQLAASGALRTPGWHQAFAAVPREHFVPAYAVRTQDGMRTHRKGEPEWLHTVYRDVSLLTQFDSHGTATSSSTQPSLMAHMLEALNVVPGDRVLEIGTGTGYNAALMTHRLGNDNVFSLDVDPTLAATAQTALQTAGYTPSLTVGDGTRGWPEHAPYHGLIATCGIGRIPDAWRQQVHPGGVIVANLGLGIARLTIHEDHSGTGPFLPHPAAFMTARELGDDSATPTNTTDLARATDRSRQVPLAIDLGDLMPQFLTAIAHPDTEQLRLGEQRCLLHRPSGSWTKLTPGPDGEALVEHGGPRDLWAEVEPLLTGWTDAGSPPLDAYQLHITSSGQHLLGLHGTTWKLGL